MTNPNDPSLKSWLEIPQNSDFPIQNLPFGVFKINSKTPRIGTAIGDQILDLAVLHEEGFFDELNIENVFDDNCLNNFMNLGKSTARKVRAKISELLQHDCNDLKDNPDVREKALLNRKDAEMLMPVYVPNYTDFYSSEEHARNVGTMFRDPDNALFPNWKHLPVGYHGRASSIVVSGTDIIRPKGQTKADDASSPSFGPCKLLDFELETAFITCENTPLGQAISVEEAEDYIFGMVLFNDWSARDIQKWEYVPLGPFLGKNFGSSVSPWVVTLDALEPFKTDGPLQDPTVLPYLQTEGPKNYDIKLEAAITPANAKETVVCRSNTKYLYWNMLQQLAHHTVNGCNIETGDMYGSGTISGPSPGSYGSMLELGWKGTRPLKMSDGSERKFILDHDTVTLRAHAEKNGIRIGFGEVKNKILPAV